MISEIELRAMLNDLESDRIERTISTNNTSKFSQAVCAFANDLPNSKKNGYLIIGAKDDGTSAGLEITDQLLINLAALRSDGNISPIPHINVSKLNVDGSDYAIVEVFPSDYPPVRYKGSVFIRVGPRKEIASQQEERVLTEKRISNARSFDSSAVTDAQIAEMSLSLFSSYRQQVIASDIIEANHRSVEAQLASLRFYDTTKNCPTVAGLLLFGKNPRFFIPGAYIQYLDILGERLTDDIANQAEISGDLLTVLRELDTRVKSIVQTKMVGATALTERLIFDYPERAVRELLMNAVMHRDYQSNAPIKFYKFSDRIEIHSPGGPYGVVTMETLEHSSDYRNPIIAESMKPLGYVNRFGYGIQKAKRSLLENGSLPAEFSCDGKVFLSIIRKRVE